MPFEVHWYRENRVVLNRPYGHMSADDMRAMNAEVMGFIQDGAKSGAQKVHTIIDVRELDRIPFDVGQLVTILKHVRDPHQGWIVMVGAKSPIRILASIVSRAARARFHSVATLAMAVAFLREADSSLADLSPPEEPIA